MGLLLAACLFAAPAGDDAWVMASVAMLREAPDAKAAVRAKLPINTKVRRQRVAGDWSEVTAGKQRGFLQTVLLASEPVTMGGLLDAWRTGSGDSRAVAERAMALDERDPRAMAIYVRALANAQDEATLARVLLAVDERYREWMGDMEATDLVSARRELTERICQRMACDEGAAVLTDFSQFMGLLAPLDGEVRQAHADKSLERVPSPHLSGGYPKSFIRWLARSAHLPDGPTRLLAQTIYETFMSIAARRLYAALPELVGRSSTELTSDFVNGFAGRGYGVNGWCGPLEGFARHGRRDRDGGRDARGFWLRRYNEGTADLAALALEKLLVLYDSEALLNVSAVPRSGGRFFPSPRADDLEQPTWLLPGWGKWSPESAVGKQQWLAGSFWAVGPWGAWSKVEVEGAGVKGMTRQSCLIITRRKSPPQAPPGGSDTLTLSTPGGQLRAKVARGASGCKPGDDCPYESFQFTVAVDGRSPVTRSGMSVALWDVGDLDGDGADELAVATYQYPEGSVEVLRVYPRHESLGSCQSTWGG